MKKFEESMFFILDTVSDGIYVAILRGKDELASIKLEKEESRKSEAIIFKTIKDLFKRTKLGFDDIDCYGVINGMGSWTGARIGVAIIKAFTLGGSQKIIELEKMDISDLEEKYKNNSFVRLDKLEPRYEEYIVRTKSV
ncbi:MAG: hypothetical protein FWE45_02820 [Firmicutes bacterium]|nr:hypothetical protein [Bacillota bacterium]